MRIVVNINVLISAALKDKSVPAVALHLALQNGVLLNSPATEAQLFAVLARPFSRHADCVGYAGLDRGLVGIGGSGGDYRADYSLSRSHR